MCARSQNYPSNASHAPSSSLMRYAAGEIPSGDALETAHPGRNTRGTQPEANTYVCDRRTRQRLEPKDSITGGVIHRSHAPNLSMRQAVPSLETPKHPANRIGLSRSEETPTKTARMRGITRASREMHSR